MKHVVKHDLSPELAKKAAEAAIERYTTKWQKYDAKAEWRSESHAEISFKVKGVSAKATVDMEPNQLVIDMQVPLVLRPFKNKALSVIEEVIQKWIDKAKNGELD